MLSTVYELQRRIGFRRLSGRRGRAALTLGGIALGVALLTAVQLIDSSVSASFRESVAAISGQAQLTVDAGDSGFSEEQAEKLRDLPGVATILPLLEVHAGLLGQSGSKQGTLEVLGFDFTDGEALRTYQKGLQGAVRDPLTFLSVPDSILVTRRFASGHSLSLGSRLALFTPSGPRELIVRGIVADEGPARAFGGAIAFMDIEAARLAFGRAGKVDRVNVSLAPGATRSAVRAAIAEIRQRLGPGFEVKRVGDRAPELEASVRAFETLLRFFGALSLLIALMLVTHSLSASVLERRTELGSLRALGARRGHLLLMLLGEAVAQGLLGSIVGVAAGLALARALAPAAAHAMSLQAQSQIHLAGLAIDATSILLPLAVGVLASAVAIFPTASKVSFTPVLELLGPSPVERAGATRKSGWPVLASGALLLAWPFLLRALAPGYHAAPLAWLGPVSGILGAFLAGTSLARAVLRRASRSRAPSVTWNLAVDNLCRGATRLRRNLVSLMIGLMLVVLVGTARESFRATLAARFDSTVREDLIVASSGNLVSGSVEPISEKIGAEISRVPGVYGAYAMRVSHARYGGEEIGIKAFDEPGPEVRYANFALIDRPASEAGPELYRSADPTAFVSETFARRFGKRTGDTVTIPTPTGPATLRVIGIVADVSTGGFLIMSRDRYKKLWNDSQVTGFGVRVRRDADPVRVRQLIDDQVARPRALTITSSRGLRRQMLGAINQGFGSLAAVEFAALLAGMLGVMNTGMTAMLERRREIATLRALGMTTKGVARMVWTETLIQGGLAAVFSAVFGIWIAREWIAGSLTGTFGWSIAFHPSWSALALAFGASLLASAIAAQLPSRLAARTPIVEALKNE